jgi:hypothetical protein
MNSSRDDLARALADPFGSQGDMLGPYQSMGGAPQALPLQRPSRMPQPQPLDQEAFQNWLSQPGNAEWYQRIIRPGS